MRFDWTIWAMLILHRRMIYDIVIVIIYVRLVYSDTFVSESTRQTGDRPIPPNGSGSASWWLLTNTSVPVLANNPWLNSSANTSTFPSIWLYNTTGVPSWISNISNAPWSNGGDFMAIQSTNGTPQPPNTIGSISQIPSSTRIETATLATPNSTTPIAIGWQVFFTNSTPTPTMSSVFLTYTNVSFEFANWNARNITNLNATTPMSIASTKDPMSKQVPTDRLAPCRRHSEAELYNLLQDKGGYNQYFMANSPEEVGMLPGFRLADDSATVSDVHGEIPKRIQRSPVDPSNKRVCDDRCRKISSMVQGALNDFDRSLVASIEKSLARDAYDNTWNKSIDSADLATTPYSTNDTKKTTRPNEKVSLTSSLCNLDKFIPIGQCDQRGEEEYSGLHRLCTACRGVYRLPNGCFPQFLNAITCNTTDVHCIFDVWTPGHEPHGTCQEKTISFTVMHNLGTDQCQDWHFESINVPIACQCYLNKESWLRA